MIVLLSSIPFDFWHDFFWPTLLTILLIPILGYFYLGYVRYNHYLFRKKLQDFYKNVGQIAADGDKGFYRDATAYADKNILKFSLFTQIWRGEPLAVTDENTDWNNNTKMSKLKHFYYYLEKVSDDLGQYLSYPSPKQQK